MAVGGAGYESAQPRNYDPGQVLSTAPLRVWGTSGNTDTVIDAACHPGAFIDLSPISIPNGFWKFVAGQGSFVVTSSDSETASTMQYYYRIRA